jgi:hypothetical protein
MEVIADPAGNVITDINAMRQSSYCSGTAIVQRSCTARLLVLCSSSFTASARSGEFRKHEAVLPDVASPRKAASPDDGGERRPRHDPQQRLAALRGVSQSRQMRTADCWRAKVRRAGHVIQEPLTLACQAFSVVGPPSTTFQAGHFGSTDANPGTTSLHQFDGAYIRLIEWHFVEDGLLTVHALRFRNCQ